MQLKFYFISWFKSFETSLSENSHYTVIKNYYKKLEDIKIKH